MYASKMAEAGSETGVAMSPTSSSQLQCAMPHGSPIKDELGGSPGEVLVISLRATRNIFFVRCISHTHVQETGTRYVEEGCLFTDRFCFVSDPEPIYLLTYGWQNIYSFLYLAKQKKRAEFSGNHMLCKRFL